MTELGCDYRGMDFGARYIDSCCIDGFLWDLDSGDGDCLSVGGDIPCPQCNHEAWISYISDDIEFRGYFLLLQGLPVSELNYLQVIRKLKEDVMTKTEMMKHSKEPWNYIGEEAIPCPEQMGDNEWCNKEGGLR